MFSGFTYSSQGSNIYRLFPWRTIKEDPDDNKFLEVAVEGKADYIISGDKDLLRLGSFMGIKIIPPSEMVKILKNL